MREGRSVTAEPMRPPDWMAKIGNVVGQVTSAFDTRLFMQIGGEFARDPITASRFFLPFPDTPTAWREIANKVGVYLLVRDSARILGLTPGEPFSLDVAVGRAYAAGAYQALWALEGLGHEYADYVRMRGEALGNLLRVPRCATLPPGSELMLHAGMGLAFAQRELEVAVRGGAAADLQTAVRTVVALCRDNSASGFTGAALESLGLVTRTFHPSLVSRVDAHLGEIDPSVCGFFWHGVGRAIYFLPVNFVPCGHVASRALRMVRDEAIHGIARRHAMAGFAWAYTLVNMRHPDVVGDLVARQCRRLSEDDAFANGVASTMAMRQDTTPDASLITAFLSYRPMRAIAADWDRLVRGPAARGVAAQADLRRTGRLDQVFRYQPAEAGGVQGAPRPT